MARTDLSKGLLSRYEKLEGQRQNWETHWQEVADYMQPRKAKAKGRSSTIMTSSKGVEDDTLTLGRRSLLGK